MRMMGRRSRRGVGSPRGEGQESAGLEDEEEANLERDSSASEIAATVG